VAILTREEHLYPKTKLHLLEEATFRLWIQRVPFKTPVNFITSFHVPNLLLSYKSYRSSTPHWKMVGPDRVYLSFNKINNAEK
jgi:hypothetical protein